jgi:predicted RNA-binding protein YlxR (DUF448 family)
VATNEVKDPNEMVRFVLGPEGQVMPDIAGKLPGRGVWVSANRAAVAQAVKTGGFARGFKSKVSVSKTLADLTQDLLCRRILNQLAMALKSGQIYLGFDQVKAAAQTTALAWRIEASDGSEDGRGKIRVLTKAVSRELERPEPGLVGCFTAAELGQALGRERMVHMALKPGKLSKSFAVMAQKLAGFRDLVPADWPDREHESSISPLVGRKKA